MKELISCKINGEFVFVSTNSVKTKNVQLQIELVKRLIECKEILGTDNGVLALFYNKYLNKYKPKHVRFTEMHQNIVTHSLSLAA